MTEERVALCRCGHSGNKPFCDNAHLEAGFTDEGSLGEKGVVEGQREQLELTLRPVPNGPVLCDGPLVVKSDDGEVERSGVNTALCRCGESSKKPFCDGTHSRVGFVAD